MKYYEVWVASQRYRSDDPLTYGSETALQLGSIVAVELQNQIITGIVVRKVSKPSFATKDIIRKLTLSPLPDKLLKLQEWLASYYPAPKSSLLQLFIPTSLATKSKHPIFEEPSTEKSIVLPNLTVEQRQAIQQINSAGTPNVLLHGETGTGKTRVYMELAKQTLSEGKSVIALTPEIGLTSQLANSFSHLGFDVITLHSGLTQTERRKLWFQLIEKQTPTIVVGTRSALFSPLKDVGLFILDEAHDNAYKQDQSPRYQSSRVAAKLANLHGAKLIMGTATPSVQDYFTFINKNLLIVSMKKPAIKTAVFPKITVINSSDNNIYQKSVYFSEPLISAVTEALNNNEQSLIFLNRRGTARVILCNECGWQVLCPNCDTALIFHADTHNAKCHTCGYKITAPTFCGDCQSTEIIYKSAGTKALVTEIERLFPDATIMRFDTDTAKHERLESQYKSVLSGKIDILVGTQMLSKGLDLPKLSVVGIVQADTSLLIPDIYSNELTYQQVSQIIGRVGRGHRLGKVIIQAHDPSNNAIQAAVKHDYLIFYNKEIKEREKFLFPPYCFLLKLECSRGTKNSASKAATTLFNNLKLLGLPVRILGPSPSFYEKINNKYRWQLIIKTKRRAYLTQIIKHLPANWTYDIDPTNLL